MLTSICTALIFFLITKCFKVAAFQVKTSSYRTLPHRLADSPMQLLCKRSHPYLFPVNNYMSDIMRDMRDRCPELHRKSSHSALLPTDFLYCSSLVIRGNCNIKKYSFLSLFSPLIHIVSALFFILCV